MFVAKKHDASPEAQSGASYAPQKRDFTPGTLRQRNRAKPLRNLVLDLKKWIGHVHCEKTRRNFGSTKWSIVCTPKPDFTTGTLRQWNRVKPPRTLVLALKEWNGHLCCEQTRRNFGSTKWCITHPRHLTSQRVPFGNRIDRNHSEHEF